ncbi:hypothetical protein Syun_017911 [Stephania yunnanensis]|uniref:DUF3741 domain-containing protein n=1 Tax=Stephania yunnanensis TaxID=152371 RepID=A0AAP0P3U0_9MAGN
MKKGLSNFCNGDGSTSTLNQKPPSRGAPSSSYFVNDATSSSRTPTLEEMIMNLELKEAAARKKKLDDYANVRARMSCVNNSDVLLSARNALNQYPRFSLDGRDSMYRSSFRNSTAYEGGRKSVCCGTGLRGRLSMGNGFDDIVDFERNLCMPPTVAGESVIWCRPSVVAKLMGLESMPVPISTRSRRGTTRKQCIRRVRERPETEKMRRVGISMNGGCRGIERDNNGYLVMNPISSELRRHEGKNWYY